MDKDTILKHTDELSAQQLADFIIKGVVTLEELKKTELLDRTKRVAITKLIEAGQIEKQKKQAELDRADNDAWERVKYSNKEIDFLNWINDNPNNKHIQDAKDRLDFLQNEKARILNEKQGVLDNIRRNPNCYPANKIIAFLNDGMCTKEDLHNYCGIPQSAIDNLYNIKRPSLELGDIPESIPTGYTEVYFWGYTGSGKTCALGAILKTGENRGNLKINTGPGYRYATQLKNIFTDNGKADDFLPAQTPSEKTQYLPFTLKRRNEKGTRNISLVELSGEIFKIFFDKNAGIDFKSGSHENTFKALSGFLNNDTNRKIHFFFIDYERTNRVMEGNFKQSDYLSASATYFQNNNIFKRSTDAIYIVLTKSDLLLDENNEPVPEARRLEYAKKYLNKNYTAFINTMKDICRVNSINGGKITVEPFSLGKVYFKDICDFDDSTSSKIIQILMDRIPRTKKSIFSFLNK